MRAIVLINGALQGGELGQLLLPVAVAAAYDLGVIAPDRQIGPLSGVALLTLIAPELQEAERMHRQAERAMAAMHPDGESPEA